MRIQMFGSSLIAVAALVGCGGDDGKNPVVHDAKVFMDAPIDAPPMCAVDKTIGAIRLGQVAANEPATCAAGTMAGTNTCPMRADADWYFTPTMGPNMGKKEFYFGAALDAIEMEGKSPDGYADVLIIQVVKGTAFNLNAPYVFEADPSSTVLNAYAILIGDLNDAGTELTNFMWGTSGAITFTKIGEADYDKIDGTVNSVTYKDIDDQNNIIAGGCETTIAGLTLSLLQIMDTMPATGKPEGSAPAGVHLTDKQWQLVQKRFDKLHEQYPNGNLKIQMQ